MWGQLTFAGHQSTVSLEAEMITIGRLAENTIIVPDLRILHKHAHIRINRDKNICYFTNLSFQVSWVNNRRVIIGEEVPLSHESTIYLIYDQFNSYNSIKFFVKILVMATPEQPKIAEEDDLKCPICLEILYKPITLSCGHKYCMACLTEWSNSIGLCVCPCCRGTPRYLQHDEQLQLDIEQYLDEHPDKMRDCKELSRMDTVKIRKTGVFRFFKKPKTWKKRFLRTPSQCPEL